MTTPPFADFIAQTAAQADTVAAAVRAVPGAHWDAPLPGGEGGWTRRQLLAHLATNDLRQLTRVRLATAQAQPGDYEDYYAQSDTDGWNAAQVEARAALTPAALLAEFQARRAELVDLLRRLTPEQTAAARLRYRGTVGGLADWFPVLLAHTKTHLRDITA